MISKIINFITTDIWRIRLKDLPRAKSILIKQLRIVLLSVRGFDEDKCFLRASALTFYSILSIVPIAAMAFGIAKGFGFEKLLEKRLLESFTGQEEVMMKIINFSHSLLENTKGGMIAGIGVAILFWTVIKVLSNIERSFNDIWGIKKARTFVRKFSDYLSIMLICPLLIIISSSLTVFISTQIKLITEKIALLGMFSPVIFFFLAFLPYCMIWVLFTFVYIFLPNAKVNFGAAIMAAIIAGTTFQIVQGAYITFQVGVAKYNAIYGSFAALPLFLLWLQVSWLIVLFGAEMSFAKQNVDTYEFEQDCLQTSYSFKKLLSLRIANVLIKNFSKGEKPFTSAQVSHTLEIPIRLVNQILFELVESGIISEVKREDDKEVTYQPALATEKFTISFVIDNLEKSGSDDIPVAESSELDKLSECLAVFDREIKKSPANMLLKDI